MLSELKIRNFAIIDDLKVSFGSGLNIITGETGAGKSIIIGAISLLLGERASPDMIRTAADSAEVEALFDIASREDLKEKMIRMGYDAADEIVIRRTVSRTGRNRVYVNGSLATLNLLADLSASLVNICSQHEHQLILDADKHLDILDGFGGLLPGRSEYEALYGEYQSLRTRLEGLQALNQKRVEREEFLRYQLREIREAGVKPDEDAALQDEKRILSNARKLMDHASRSYEVLYGRERPVLGEVRGALQDIREIKKIDPSLAISPDDLESLFFHLEDAALALREYLKRIAFNPQRLTEIEDRLELLGRLKKKYGPTLEDVARTAAGLDSELRGMDSIEEEMARLAQEGLSRQSALFDRARDLSQKRRKTSRKLKEAVEREIRDLRMAEARFDVNFAEPAGDGEGEGKPCLTARGMDTTEFYLSTNVGEDLKPLNRIASGGELSRIILAMKKVLARTGSVDSIIFDEVDSGIGGATAEVVGGKLKDVSHHHQVFCITHLPQIACFGDRHYLVSKTVKGERTNSRVQLLSEPERLQEITRMLGGVELTDRTVDHAREMLRKAGKKTRNPKS